MDGQYTGQNENNVPLQDEQLLYQQSQEVSTSQIGPRKLTFLTLVLKSFAGLGGGIAGTLVLILIFLSTSSILNPVIGQAVATENAAGEVSPLFMVILMGMVLATSVVSSLLGTLFLSYTERDRYTRIPTTMSQVFIINIVIFIFVLPIYLTTSTARIELTAFAAFMQVILSATASAMILELIHDQRYSLLSVYTTMLAILVAMGLCFFIYFSTGTATIMLFSALPIIWASIGFWQAALTMLYYWVFETWGTDFLAQTAVFGADYGVPDTSEEEITERDDVDGSSFLKS